MTSNQSIFGLKTLQQKKREIATQVIRQEEADITFISRSEESSNKIVLVIVVYNRYENLVRWLTCLKTCILPNTEVRVIHNYDNVNESIRYKELCDQHKVTYVGRKNIGFDLGAFQDVCRERLPGFANDWSYLFWVTDDTIPVKKGFLAPFIRALKDLRNGVACLELSKEVRLHIRTSGFMIPKYVANRLQFSSDPILTKKHCYEFEHLGTNTFADQIRRMGLKTVMPVDYPNGDLWDTHHRARQNRWMQFYDNFPDCKVGEPVPIKERALDKKVTIICPIYNSYPQIISSLICQTHVNWQLLLVHDGINRTNISKIVEDANDSRITYFETKGRINVWGHDIRRNCLEQLDSLSPYTDYVVITNPDNYHTPTYLHELLKGFGDTNTVATYCSKFIHGYLSPQIEGDAHANYRWGVIDAKMQLGYIDCAGVMVKKEIAQEVGWRSMEKYSDWTYFKDIIDKYGVESFKKVNGCLLIHN